MAKELFMEKQQPVQVIADKDTILSVDDLFMLTFMDENGENIVQD